MKTNIFLAVYKIKISLLLLKEITEKTSGLGSQGIYEMRSLSL